MSRMSDAIVVLNAGSSSLKFAVYSRRAPTGLNLEARGQVEGLGTSPRFKAADRDGRSLPAPPLAAAGPGFGHPEAFASLVEWLRETLGDSMSPVAVGHRVVHGGAAFARPTLVDADVLAQLEALVPLAPLHQPHNLAA